MEISGISNLLSNTSQPRSRGRKSRSGLNLGHVPQQITHPPQHPASSCPPPPSSVWLSPPELAILDLFLFFFSASAESEGIGICRTERWTIVGGAGLGRNLSMLKVSSSCSIFPRYKILRYAGAGGCSICHSEGQAFQTNSLTRPIVVFGSNDIVFLRPETRRNVSCV